MSNTVQRAAHIQPVNLLSGIPTQPDRNSAPATSTPVRLVPAIIGRKGRTVQVYIECPEWCTVDHSTGNVQLEDITHYSTADVAQVPTFFSADTSHTDLTLSISSDPTSSDPRCREAHLLVDTCTDEEARLTPELAEALADDLIAFASQLRHKARQVAAFNRKQAQR